MSDLRMNKQSITHYMMQYQEMIQRFIYSSCKIKLNFTHEQPVQKLQGMCLGTVETLIHCTLDA